MAQSKYRSKINQSDLAQWQDKYLTANTVSIQSVSV